MAGCVCCVLLSIYKLTVSSSSFSVTKTWFRPYDTDSFIADVMPPGYKCTHVPHSEGRGGGVEFFIRDDIDFKVLPQLCINTFESISVRLSIGNTQDIIFREDILNSDLIKHPHKTSSLPSHQYFTTFHDILNRHAPVNRKKVPLHPNKGFMNSDILLTKHLKRKYEHGWHRDKSAINRIRYLAAVNCYNFLLEVSKRRHSSPVIAENNGNPKALWNTFKKILHKSLTIILTDHVSPKDQANSFGHFSMTKLRKSKLHYSHRPQSRPSINNSALSSFEPVSEDDILKIIKSSPTKSCDLDPMPTSLAKECADNLITPLPIS